MYCSRFLLHVYNSQGRTSLSWDFCNTSLDGAQGTKVWEPRKDKQGYDGLSKFPSLGADPHLPSGYIENTLRTITAVCKKVVSRRSRPIATLSPAHNSELRYLCNYFTPHKILCIPIILGHDSRAQCPRLPEIFPFSCTNHHARGPPSATRNANILAAQKRG